jgi:hypothetical protein
MPEGIGYGPGSGEPGSDTGQNALLPRSIFGDGVKPGDTITLKVSAVFGDEVEVSASASPEQEPEENQEPPELTADEEIEAAAESSNYAY